MLLLDAATRVGGRSAFRDHLDPRIYHTMPAPPVVKRAELSPSGLELEVDALGVKAPPRNILFESAMVSLVRFSAEPSPSGPRLALRTVMAAEAPHDVPSRVLMRKTIDPTDRAELLKGESARLALVTTVRFSGIEPPLEVVGKARLREASNFLLERFGPQPFFKRPHQWFEEILCHFVELDTEIVSGSPEEAFFGRWLEAELFEPKPTVEVLNPKVFDNDPALRMVREGARRAVAGWQVKPPSGVESEVDLDLRQGMLRSVQAILASAVPPGLVTETKTERPSRFGAHPGADWTGVEQIEVELRHPKSKLRVVELTEGRPTASIVKSERIEVRARAIPNEEAVLLSEPEWIEWTPLQWEARWDPQSLLQRRRLDLSYAWVDPVRIRPADIELRGTHGSTLCELSGQQPEQTVKTVGSFAHIELLESPSGESGYRVLQDRNLACLLDEGSVPVLVRLCDPLGRYQHAHIELIGAGDRRSVTLSEAAPEAIWSPPSWVRYQVRLSLKYRDGRVEPTQTFESQARLLKVGDGDIELRTLELHAYEHRLWVVAEAEPPLRVGRGAIGAYLDPGTTSYVRVPFEVGSPLEYRVSGEILDDDGPSSPINAKVSSTPRWDY